MTIDLKQIAEESGYTLDAFVFVQRGLDYTVRHIHGDVDDEAEQDLDNAKSRHVSGQDLCLGLRDFAIQQYGLMARSVLQRWGLKQSEDFGNIVFAMVDAGLMHKTDEDDIEDFKNVFDFHEAFAPTLTLAAPE